MPSERSPSRDRPRNGLLIAGTALLVLGLAILWSGCGGGGGGSSEGKKLRIGLMITPRGLNDQGFNDLAFLGMKNAEQKYGIETVIIEPATMKDPEASLRFFTAQRFDGIIAVGVAFLDAIRKIAKERPDLNFFVIDSSLKENNIQGVAFREDEGSFLCGFLAAKVSKTGKIGFIGGVKIDVIERFLNGFRNGANLADPKTIVVERFIGEDFSGFNRPDQAHEIARDLYTQGCDVIYHAAGASGLGVISAAVQAKKFVIGVDMNQDSLAPGLVLTSMLKRVDLAVEDVVKALYNGKGPAGVNTSYGMSDGVIDLTDFQFSHQVVGDTLIARIAEIKREIVAGRIRTSDVPPKGVVETASEAFPGGAPGSASGN